MHGGTDGKHGPEDQTTRLEIESWERLAGLAEFLDTGDGLSSPYLFRGHENAEWRLEPTLHRAATLEGTRPLPAADNLLALESKATKRFRAAAPNELPAATFSATNTELEWWTLMRHYGAPTRLIDWTTSIFIAAYFACRGCPDKEGSIYLVHENSLRVGMRRVHGGAADIQLTKAEFYRQLADPGAPDILRAVQRETALLPRMILQRAVFMVSMNVATDIEKTLSAVMGGESRGKKETYRKLIVPADVKPVLMRRLRDTNITGDTLFPGLDGIGRALDEVVRWR